MGYSNANRRVVWVIYGAFSGLSVEFGSLSCSDGRRFQYATIEWYACREKVKNSRSWSQRVLSRLA